MMCDIVYLALCDIVNINLPLYLPLSPYKNGSGTLEMLLTVCTEVQALPRPEALVLSWYRGFHLPPPILWVYI